MLKLFTTNEFDNDIIIIDQNKKYTVLDIKKLIANHTSAIKSKKENIVISNNDNFIFIIQFFASIFANKNIYLVSDKTKLQFLDFDFDTIDDIELKNSNDIEFQDKDTKNTIINFYTSGSIAKPKNVKKSLYNLIQEAKDIIEEFDFKNIRYEVLSTTTMRHLFGMTFHLMFPLCAGYIINTEEFNYAENINTDNSILVSTPAFLSKISKHNLNFAKNPKYIISAGSKLDIKTFEHLEKQSNIIEIYGSTETGVIAHKTHFCDNFTIFSNVKIKANEENTQVYSQYSYENMSEINDKIEINGKNLKILDRTDRLFKIQEKRISAQELEDKLKNCDLIDDCYMLKTAEKLGCICALSETGKKYFLKHNIVKTTKYLKQYLSNFSEIIPQKWKYIDEIPMTKTGKRNKEQINHIFNINLSLPLIINRKISQNEITYKLYFYNQCNFFQGHFPNFQILPGVAQLYIAKEFANSHFNLKLGMGQWKRIKFSNIIKPDSIVELKLKKTDKEVTYEYYNENKKCSSGVFLCENIFKEALK